MPDLTIHPAAVCTTNLDWTKAVPGSRGATYTVRFGMLFGRDAEVQGCQYGYTCTCAAFTKSKRSHLPCKHIQAVEASGERCSWNWEMEPGAEAAKDEHGNACCPDCGAPVTYINVGV